MKATGKEIRSAVLLWQRLMGLEAWQFRVTIGRIAGGHRGTCDADWDYHEADLRFDPEAMAKHKDDLWEITAHETAHVLVWRSNAAAQKRSKNGIDETNLCALEENECTVVARAFLKIAREARLVP